MELRDYSIGYCPNENIKMVLYNEIKEARKFLKSAGVFFDEDDDTKLAQTLNMNDVWAWAFAFGEYVPDEKLPEVAELFWRYGWAGVLYWVSKENNNMRSEFEDVNRFIEFVKNEEQLRSDVPDTDERAYKKIKYTLGK
jgi:hypothetical protein